MSCRGTAKTKQPNAGEGLGWKLPSRLVYFFFVSSISYGKPPGSKKALIPLFFWRLRRAPPPSLQMVLVPSTVGEAKTGNVPQNRLTDLVGAAREGGVEGGRTGQKPVGKSGAPTFFGLPQVQPEFRFAGRQSAGR